MAQLTYTEFGQQYSSMFPTSTKLSDAYRQYQLSGTLPGTTTTPTTTTTTPTTTTPTTSNSFGEWLSIYHPGSHTSAELIELNVEYVNWYNTQAFPITPTTPTTPTPTPTTPTTPTEVPPITAPTITTPAPPTPPVLPTVPTITPPTMPGVEPAPPYVKSPEQIAFEETYLGKLEPWLEAGGYGISEEIQAQMIQKSTDILKARETENIRIMRNNMERQQITNSGFVFANAQQIKSVTTVAIANSIRDVQISSALMKMASFETAMGQAAQFLGYLADESLKAYAPKMAQWEMEAKYDLTKYGTEAQFRLAQAELRASYELAGYGVEAQYGMAGYQAKVQASIAQFQVNSMAIMADWQAKFDLIKMEINQAYTQGNMEFANQLLQKLQDDQQAHDIIISQMQIDAADARAKAEGAGDFLGTVSGGVIALATK